jgi:hypothetical protein
MKFSFKLKKFYLILLRMTWTENTVLHLKSVLTKNVILVPVTLGLAFSRSRSDQIIQIPFQGPTCFRQRPTSSATHWACLTAMPTLPWWPLSTEDSKQNPDWTMMTLKLFRFELKPKQQNFYLKFKPDWTITSKLFRFELDPKTDKFQLKFKPRLNDEDLKAIQVRLKKEKHVFSLNCKL